MERCEHTVCGDQLPLYRNRKYKNHMDNREHFIELLRGTGREGIEETIKVIEELGFFEALARSRFHLNQQCGLLDHSLMPGLPTHHGEAD